MGEIRFRRAERQVCGILAALLVVSAGALSASATLRDAPVVWYDDDQSDIPLPRERAPNLLWDGPKETFTRPLVRSTYPARLLRRLGSLFGGDHVPMAADVNSLGEVPSSTWFTNRIGLYPLSPEEAAKGPGLAAGPDRSAGWTVVSAKTQGVTPGFLIRDAKGDVYLIKFDPPGFLGMTTGAGVISNRILHAAGYFVPEDVAVIFRREDLLLGPGVQITAAGGKRREMTEEDLDAILSGVDRLADGGWLALSSKFLKGRPVGPFDYQGRRHDDPNDRIKHEHRRVLRGLRVFAAWLNHFDTKQHNSLDMYVEEGGKHFIRHYLIDFASTLGTGARGPAPKHGFEYAVDFAALLGKTLALGFYEADWRKLRRPEGLAEVGYWDAAYFEPEDFEPLQPNPAFVNLTDRDGYWAAKVVSAFTDDHLQAICAEAPFQDPEAAPYVARVLGQRRDIVARRWFSRVAPLDFFQYGGGIVRYRDLAAERHIFPGTTPRYRVRVAGVNEKRKAFRWSPWTESSKTETDLRSGAAAQALQEAPGSRYPFVAVTCQVDRGGGWSPSATAYLARASGRVMAVERE